MAQETTELVMVAVDGSTGAEKALHWYLDNCHQSHHQVIIMHCVEVPPLYGAVSEVNAYDAILKDCNKQAEKVRSKYSGLLREKGISGRFYSAVEANAAVWICDEASEMKPKLIVVGSRGLGAIRRTILGSVSEYVLHHAHCAVAVCTDAH